MQPHPRTSAIDGATPLVRFERQLAVAGIGTLWLGRLAAGNEAGRTVLLRRMSKDLLSDKDIEALKKVADAYSKVRHPSLVKLLGVIEQDDDIISVSEHLDGVRLCDLMRNAFDRDSPLPATVAVRVVLDAARATLKAHSLAVELGLFPTDRLFVPEGVFIAAYGGTLLSETGVLATIVRCARPRNIPDVAAQLAPEEHENVTSARGSPEVFSLGVLLWECLANRQLFSRERMSQTIEELRTRPITPLAQIERCGLPVPDKLAEIVQIATHRSPSQRYSGVAEFVSALEELPVHFIATEHHVASALRDQAADLLREFHVDHSQSSLTVAFSEVPASRLSTRPPPDDGHNWEPPTFAQRKLLSGTSFPANSVKIAISPTESSDASQAPRDASQQTSRHPRTRRYVLGLAIALLAIVGSIVLLRATHPKTPVPRLAATSVPSAPAMVPSQIAQVPTQSADSVDALAPANTAASQLLPPSTSLATDPKSGRIKKVGPETPNSPAAPESQAAPAARKSDQTYHPRNIAPYRPKGI